MEGIIETGGQIKALIDDEIVFLNGQLVTEKRKKCYPDDIISIDGLDVDFIITSEEA